MPVCHLVACSLVYFVLSRNAPGSLLGSTGCYTLSNREHGLLHPWYFEPVQGSKIVGKGDRKQHSEKTAWRLADELMHQSIPPAPRPPPPGWPPGISIFLPWMANSRGWGLLSCQIPRGGDGKRGQMPRPPSTVQHFLLIAQSNSAILMWDFLFQLTSSFVIHSFFFIRIYFIRISRLKFAKF